MQAQTDVSSPLLLGADSSSHSSRARTSKDLLHTGSAVAASLSSAAVELLATTTGAENVMLVGERVTPLGAEFVCRTKLVQDSQAMAGVDLQ